MQNMFDTVETENQLVFAEKLHFKAVNFRYHIESDITCVHTFEEVQHGYTKAEKAGCFDALKFIDENGVPEHNTSVKYVLVSENGKNIRRSMW